MSEYGRYVKPRYGPGTSFTEVRAHPLHIFASCDLTGSQIDPSKDSVVVDDVPHGVSDVLESDVLALERIAQEVLTGEPGYSGCRRRPEYCFVDGCHQSAGKSPPRASCGLSWL